MNFQRDGTLTGATVNASLSHFGSVQSRKVVLMIAWVIAVSTAYFVTK